MKETAASIRTLIHIRPMADSDIPRVMEIDRQSFSLPWPPSSYHYELHENPGSALWVAVLQEPGQDDLVVGMIVVWFIVDEAHIATLAVDPVYRRRNIARQLMDTALQAILARGFKRATLEVRANNIAAINLYRGFGFVTAGIRPRYYRDNNEDAWIMSVQDLTLENLSGFTHVLSNSGSGELL